MSVFSQFSVLKLRTDGSEGPSVLLQLKFGKALPAQSILQELESVKTGFQLKLDPVKNWKTDADRTGSS